MIKRKAVTKTYTLPNGKTITNEYVRCPGTCRSQIPIERERRPDGTVKIVCHGGGRCGLNACSASGQIIQLI